MMASRRPARSRSSAAPSAVSTASPAAADMGLIWGVGFPAFRGGALRYIDSMGAAAFCDLADRFASLGGAYQVTDGLRSMAAEGGRFFE